MSRFFAACLTALSFSLIFSPPLAHARQETLQDSTVIYQILSGINTARIANGLTPYTLNPLLMQAAQAHSEYQRDTGQVTHDGPGGTRTINRVLAVGYPAVRANENIYAGMGGPSQAVNWWLGSTAGHVQNILHTVMREVGIGAAPNADGLTYYTVVFSAQPNVLPAFINNDTYSTNTPSVILSLTNEGIFSGGPGQIGYAVQVQISNTPDFATAPFQPWAQYMSWTLDTSAGDGVRTVYIRYVDAAGRTADSQDSIVLDTSGGGVVVAPTLLPAATIAPTIFAVPQPTNPILQPTMVSTSVPTASPTGLFVATATEGLTPSPIPRIARTQVAVLPTQKQVTVLGISITVVRTVLWGTLAFGLACIVVGNLILITAQRAPQRRKKKKETDGDD